VATYREREMLASTCEYIVTVTAPTAVTVTVGVVEVGVVDTRYDVSQRGTDAER